MCTKNYFKINFFIIYYQQIFGLHTYVVYTLGLTENFLVKYSHKWRKF